MKPVSSATGFNAYSRSASTSGRADRAADDADLAPHWVDRRSMGTRVVLLLRMLPKRAADANPLAVVDEHPSGQLAQPRRARR